MRSPVLALSVWTWRRRTSAEVAHNEALEKQSGTVPKYDPAIRFYQYAGATIAHQQTQAHPATPRRFGQVNNM